jgi:trehalose/maltose hydrolase-like predicted phosphorylase
LPAPRCRSGASTAAWLWPMSRVAVSSVTGPAAARACSRHRKQVVKQADLVLAMHRGDAFTAGQKARNFASYERLTVRDSSLWTRTQAVIAAETGHLRLAYDYLAEAALMDLDAWNTTPATACSAPGGGPLGYPPWGYFAGGVGRARS